jgi:hypothetical protein
MVMKLTVEIPEEVYRQAEVKAAGENRQIDDLVCEGLRLALGFISASNAALSCRMVKAPITVRKGNIVPVLTNEVPASLLEQTGERLP